MKRLWLILFVIPIFAQDPCQDEALLEIGQKILDEGLFVGVLKEKLSANDYLTFLEKMEKCLNTDLLPSKDNYIVENHPCWHPEFLLLKYISDRDKLDMSSEEGKNYSRMLGECKESADTYVGKYAGQLTNYSNTQNPCEDEFFLKQKELYNNDEIDPRSEEGKNYRRWYTECRKYKRAANSPSSKENMVEGDNPCTDTEFLRLKELYNNDEIDAFSEEGRRYRAKLTECKESDYYEGKYTGQPTKRTYNTYSKPAMSEYEKQMLEIEKEKLAITKRQQLQDEIDRAKKQKKERNKAAFDALMGIAANYASDKSDYSSPSFPSLSIGSGGNKGCNIYGKIKFVEYGEDYKVKFVDLGANLKVKYVEYGEDSQGNWKAVEFGEDYKLKIVSYGEDFTVQTVSYGQGCN